MTETMHNADDGIQDDLLPATAPQPGWFALFFATFGTVNPITTGQAVRKGVRTFFQVALPIVVAAGTGLWHADVWEGAALAGSAAVVAFIQNAAGK